MHEKVKEYLDRKEQERLETIRKNKSQHLINLGLFEKQYVKSKGEIQHYADQDDEGPFRKIPIEVTDEEYAAICSYDMVDERVSHPENPVTNTLKAFAWIIIVCGFIAGIVLAGVWSIAVAVWTVSIVSGLIFLGLAEIIRLLQEILNKYS